MEPAIANQLAHVSSCRKFTSNLPSDLIVGYERRLLRTNGKFWRNFALCRLQAQFLSFRSAGERGKRLARLRRTYQTSGIRR